MMGKMPELETLIDPHFAQQWYPQHGLPPQLARRVGSTPRLFTMADFARPIPNYEHKLTRALVRAEYDHVPAHGHTHGSRVVWGGKQCITTLEAILGVRLPIGMVHHALYAMSRHDHRHPGAPYNQMALPQFRQVLPPGLQGKSADFTVEYTTAAWADLEDEQDADCRDDLAGREIGQYVILASTTRPPNQYSRQLKADHIRPQGFFGCVMTAVDVRPTSECTYNMQFELDLVCREISTVPVPTNREAYLGGRRAHMQNIAMQYDELDDSAQRVAQSVGSRKSFSLTAIMGWREQLQQLQEEAAMLQQGDSEAWAIFNSLLVLRGQQPI